MKRDDVYVRHILKAILQIEKYIGDLNFTEFKEDEKTADSVIRQLEIIGEAASRITKKFHDSHPELPYRSMIGMRNVLTHEYFHVIVKVVWHTAKKNLPPLKKEIDKILLEEGKALIEK